MQMLALINDAIRESRDKKLFWAMLVVSTIAAGAFACIGFDENGLSLAFGLVKVPDANLTAGSPAAQQFMAGIVSYVLVGTYIGWIGVLAFLVATAGMLPSFMADGAIEVVLGKPISRIRVFVGRYLGGLTFVGLQAIYFVLLTFLVLRFRMGVWFWEYLWAIVLLPLLFSYLYCVTVLVGVWSRNGLVSLTCTLLFWLCIAGGTTMERTFGYTDELRPQGSELAWAERSQIGKVSFVLYNVFPKTDDVSVLLGREMGAATPTAFVEGLGTSGEIRDEETARLATVDHELTTAKSSLYSIGSSLVFEAVVLSLACWFFVRKDF